MRSAGDARCAGGAYREVNGSRKASRPDPGMDLAQLFLLLVREARLVFLQVPQSLTVLLQHRLHVPGNKTEQRGDGYLFVRLFQKEHGQ